MMTIDNETILFMPTTVITAGGTAGNSMTFNNATSTSVTSQTVVVELEVSSGVAEPDTVFPFDQNFFVTVPKRFLTVTDSGVAEETQHLAMYTVSSDTGAGGMAKVTFNLKPTGLDSTIFNTFGTNSAKNRIDCVVSVVGESTGIRSTINVVLNS